MDEIIVRLDADTASDPRIFNWGTLRYSQKPPTPSIRAGPGALATKLASLADNCFVNGPLTLRPGLSACARMKAGGKVERFGKFSFIASIAFWEGAPGGNVRLERVLFKNSGPKIAHTTITKNQETNIVLLYRMYVGMTNVSRRCSYQPDPLLVNTCPCLSSSPDFVSSDFTSISGLSSLSAGI